MAIEVYIPRPPVSVDGVTITGDGTPGDPLVASGGAGAAIVTITRVALQALLAGGTALTNVIYRVTDAVGSTIIADVFSTDGSNLSVAIDQTNLYFGFYNIAGDAFINLMPFIPLAGTSVGAPVTGDIQNNAGVEYYHEVGTKRVRLFLRNQNQIAIGYADSSTGQLSTVEATNALSQMVVDNGVNQTVFTLDVAALSAVIFSDLPAFAGLQEASDYSANYTALSLTNKGYVDAKGSGTVNSGTLNRLTYYAATGTAVSELAAITALRALKSDANGLPVAFDTATEPSLTELSYVKGVTSAIQTQLDAKPAQDSAVLAQTYNAATVPASTTRFLSLYGGITDTNGTLATQRNSVVPVAGVISRLYIQTFSTQPATGSIVFTVMLNGVATSITITIAAGTAAGVFSDLSNTVTVAAGDLVCIRAVNNALASSAQLLSSSSILTR